MAKALLINPGFYIKYIKTRYQLVFPFGLGYIAAHAEKSGHQIDIWDIYGKQIKFSNVVNKIEHYDFSSYDLIGITGIVNQFSYIRELSKVLKRYTNVKIVLGGPLSSYSWEIMLNNTDIDICVIGEGEQTFLDILNGEELSSIDGIVYKADNGIKKNNDRQLMKNLDDFGFPAFHLFDMELYIKSSGMQDIIRPYYKKKRTMSLLTSRGCPYNCNFCSKSMKGIRMKSLDFIFKEIKYYKDQFRVEAIHFIDELLLLNKNRFINFCRRITKYNIIWDCQGRINLADENILKAMKEANGVLIGFGIESGSQKILINMNKRIKRSDIKKRLDYCLKINLPVKIQLIYGYPGESVQTLNETISIFKETRIPGRRFATITPLPGSLLYEKAKKDGFIGNKSTDKISEVKYLEFLSKNTGYVTPDLFYNRTEFSDENFYPNLRKLENIIFLNFVKTLITKPLFIIKHWFVYRMYLRDWWHYRNRLYFFNLRDLLLKVLIHPNKYLKIKNF